MIGHYFRRPRHVFLGGCSLRLCSPLPSMADPFDTGAFRPGKGVGIPGVWDEAQWEEYLRRHERRIESFLQDVQAFLAQQLAAPDDLPADREAALAAFLRLRGWTDPETFVAWLSADEAEAPSDPLSDEAASLANRLSAWGESLPETFHDAALVNLLVSAYDAVSMLTRAAVFGSEHDALGGAIACTKRALLHAHAAASALADVRAALRTHGHSAPDGADLAAALHEHRNAIALRILALRERYYLSVS
jgi:hypothetical protein